MAAAAVEAEAVLAAGPEAVVACRAHLAASQVAAVCRDLLAELRLGHRAACPELHDHPSAAPHRSIDRVLELHVPT